MAQAGDVDAVLHALDYIAVDYPRTVADGKVVNPNEYAEQFEFSQSLLQTVPALPANAGRDQALAQVTTLFQQIQNKRPGAEVAHTARATGQQLAQNYHVRLTPRSVPDLQEAAQLFHGKCLSCHGAEGYGNGPAAFKVDPPPINFHDLARAKERSVYGLYSAITLGVDGTKMRPFNELSEGQRWALAFYVSSFVFNDSQRAAGEKAWAAGNTAGPKTINDLAQQTPATIEAQTGVAGLAQLAYLRAHPEQVMPKVNPIDIAIEKLGASITSYRTGNIVQAYRDSVASYLEGFELAEASLRASNTDVKALEGKMMAYRQIIKDHAPLSQVESNYHALVTALDEARNGGEQAAISGNSAAVSAAVILLREGLEAILLLAAIAGVLIKTGRRDALPYLHAGWAGALILGGVTWAISSYLFEIGGANRELTEGLTALVAAVVLIYVGFWLHGKTNAKRWREFVETKIKGALQGRALWAMTFISFLAVYREVFETVLFYQALWLQTEETQHASLVGGIVGGMGALLLLGWLILRFSMKLPLRPFFAVNSIILFVLAVAFSGHGTAALQKAGIIPLDPVQMPSFELLGIYPTMETAMAQLLVISLVGFIIFGDRIKAVFSKTADAKV